MKVFFLSFGLNTTRRWLPPLCRKEPLCHHWRCSTSALVTVLMPSTMDSRWQLNVKNWAAWTREGNAGKKKKENGEMECLKVSDLVVLWKVGWALLHRRNRRRRSTGEICALSDVNFSIYIFQFWTSFFFVLTFQFKMHVSVCVHILFNNFTENVQHSLIIS